MIKNKKFKQQTNIKIKKNKKSKALLNTNIADTFYNGIDSSYRSPLHVVEQDIDVFSDNTVDCPSAVVGT